MRVHDKIYIGGQWVAPSSTETSDVIDATTEQPMGRIPMAAAEAGIDFGGLAWRILETSFVSRGAAESGSPGEEQGDAA